MLELTDVTRRFGSNVAVDAVSLSIPEGQMVGVIGRSGAGKSTLLRMINRLTGVSGGDDLGSRQDGLDAGRRELRNWQRDCAMIFQQFNLVPRLDVLTNVLLGTLNHALDVFNMSQSLYRASDIALAIAILERLGIAQTAPASAPRYAVGRPAAARRHRPGADAVAEDDPR
jgi:phosphonate transport system ATP-binding protein